MDNSKYLIFLPFLTIFLTGVIVPVGEIPYKPVFQPPNEVFGIVWTYVTLSFGYVSYLYYTRFLIEEARDTMLNYYVCVLFLLNFWLVLNNYQMYAIAFWELVISCYVSILYIVFLTTNAKTQDSAKYVYFILPLPFWLVLASSLNGVIYDYVSKH
jgi:tryptophan-rich sensory protein